MKIKAEYIWIDGKTPTAKLRSKTKIMDQGTEPPIWGFDGSSTEQATGDQSDCVLKPVAQFPDPIRGGDNILVMCEVMNADGTPHASNGRATIEEDDDDFWFGYEQEYFLWDPETNLPYGFPRDQTPQGQFYCSVGAMNTFGRDIIEAHLDMCIDAGLNVEGINAEVAVGQWEYQIFAKGAKEAGDQIWVSRYLAERNAEKYGLAIEWHPKPLGATDWNGSGMHVNFSDGKMRDEGGEALFTNICEAFGRNIEKHMSVYGAHNELRLTGLHETQSIDQFSFGVSDRGASIRIPIGTIEDG